VQSARARKQQLKLRNLLFTVDHFRVVTLYIYERATPKGKPVADSNDGRIDSRDHRSVLDRASVSLSSRGNTIARLISLRG